MGRKPPTIPYARVSLVLVICGLIAVSAQPLRKTGAVRAKQKPLLEEEELREFSSKLPLVIIESRGVEITHDEKTLLTLRLLSGPTASHLLAEKPAFEGPALANIRGHSSLRYPKHSYSLKLVNPAREGFKASLLGLPSEAEWVLYGPYPDKTLLRDFLAYELSNQMGRWAPHGKFVELFVNESATPLAMRHYMGVYLLEEKVTRDKERVDIAKLDPSFSQAPDISGGYIFKKDHASRSERKGFGEDGPPQLGQASDRTGYPTPPGGFPADPAGFLPAYGRNTRTSGPINKTAPANARPRKMKSKPVANQSRTNYVPTAIPEGTPVGDATVFSDEERFHTSQQGNEFYYVEPEPDTITPIQRAWLKNYLNGFESVLYGPEFSDPIKGYAAWIDPDSFIDHHLLVEATKNVDGFRFSTYYYKNRGKPLCMGPAWDWNLSFGNASGKHGYLPEQWLWPQLDDQQYTWFRRLFEDPDFGQRYVDRWTQLRTNVFATARILARIDQLAAELHEAQARNFAKWQILGEDVSPNYYVGATYKEEIDWMKDWISRRLAWIDAQFVPKPSLKSGPELILETTVPSAKVYYTLDGSDPRSGGGALSSGARLYETPIALAKTQRIQARALSGNRWSGPLLWESQR